MKSKHHAYICATTYLWSFAARDPLTEGSPTSPASMPMLTFSLALCAVKLLTVAMVVPSTAASASNLMRTAPKGLRCTRPFCDFDCVVGLGVRELGDPSIDDETVSAPVLAEIKTNKMRTYLTFCASADRSLARVPRLDGRRAALRLGRLHWVVATC